MRIQALGWALSLACAALAGCAGPKIVLVRGDGATRDAFEARGLDPTALEQARRAGAPLDGALTVHVISDSSTGGETLPAVAGSTRCEGGVIRFEPAFPLEPGLRYAARLHDSAWTGDAAGAGSGTKVEAQFTLPQRDVTPRIVVERVYPSADVLPENLLKFYIHFSGPMRRGEAYHRVRLLDAGGRPVAAPFLELGEELWDRDGERFTLFIDPGRIKRGVRPHEELGPALETGRRYTLSIDAGWLDAAGAPLASGFQKSFRVAAPDYDPPDPAAWKIAPVGALTRDPLRIALGEPLDRALLVRLVRVRGPDGDEVQGEKQTGEEERVWTLVPEAPWKPGRYELLVDSTLEDLAGNSVGRPFEVDTARRLEDRIELRTVSVPFEVGAAPPSAVIPASTPR